jgi:carboxypeptidase C (cathepsin A)
MKSILAAVLLATVPTTLTAAPPSAHHPKRHAPPPKEEAAPDKKPDASTSVKQYFQPTEVRSTGSVTVGGQPINFDAISGTLVVHAKDWQDTDQVEADADSDSKSADKNAPKPEASMFFTAFFKQGVPSATRPITFLFNGGPGSSTVWLRMGAFGPVRVQTLDARHTPAPYFVVNNDQSLLDASDLVFIDAPGTGFSRVAGKDKEKAFYGVDQDIHAFTDFISQLLTKYGRWSSPKYVFGESYGTMRGAGLALALQRDDIDLNGVVLLQRPPGTSTRCRTALPTSRRSSPRSNSLRLPITSRRCSPETNSQMRSVNVLRHSFLPSQGLAFLTCSRATLGSSMERSRRSCSATAP